MIGLSMNPPQHAAVFCVDEKTAIQALDRLDPSAAAVAWTGGTHDFEYNRHGTLSLSAALDVKTGEVHGMMEPQHTAQPFIAFLTGLVERAEWARKVHVVLDNLSAHKQRRSTVS